MTSIKFLLTILLLVFAVPAFGQSTLKKCNATTTIQWTMNAEPDMLHYDVYQGGVPNVTIGGVGVTSTEIPHEPANGTVQPGPLEVVRYPLVITTEGDTYFVVTATDDSGNESPLSNEVGCDANFTPVAPTIELIFQQPVTPPTP
jgi:hypothetical protein